MVLECLGLNSILSGSGGVGVKSFGSRTESKGESNYIHCEILEYRDRSFVALKSCKSMTNSCLVPKNQGTALP